MFSGFGKSCVLLSLSAIQQDTLWSYLNPVHLNVKGIIRIVRGEGKGEKLLNPYNRPV